ncbi:MAG: hypothetical protein VKJ27_09295 [Synechocystis sp.]|nr:hypothetical protein [Synechocystis sp.]
MGKESDGDQGKWDETLNVLPLHIAIDLDRGSDVDDSNAVKSALTDGDRPPPSAEDFFVMNDTI